MDVLALGCQDLFRGVDVLSLGCPGTFSGEWVSWRWGIQGPFQGSGCPGGGVSRDLYRRAGVLALGCPGTFFRRMGVLAQECQGRVFCKYVCIEYGVFFLNILT
jgi:hypothetical protein